MNEFREPACPGPNDPLERLVEAFVEQSVPEGPDSATQRRLLAKVRARDYAAFDAAYPGQQAVSRPSVEFRGDDAGARARPSRVGRWSRTFAKQAIGLAAGMAAVVAGAVYLTPARNEAIQNAGPAEGVLAHAPLEGDGSVGRRDPIADAAALESPATKKLANRLMDAYLRTHDGQRPDRAAFNAFVAQILDDNPDLANEPWAGSESWQFAQQRLSTALEQPEVIGVGIGLLGTLPWTTYARF